MGDNRTATLESLIAVLYRRGRYDDAERYIERLIRQPDRRASLWNLWPSSAPLQQGREGLKSAIDLAEASL